MYFFIFRINIQFGKNVFGFFLDKISFKNASQILAGTNFLCQKHQKAHFCLNYDTDWALSVNYGRYWFIKSIPGHLRRARGRVHLLGPRAHDHRLHLRQGHPLRQRGRKVMPRTGVDFMNRVGRNLFSCNLGQKVRMKLKFGWKLRPKVPHKIVNFWVAILKHGTVVC
jgi:hypothetical protein